MSRKVLLLLLALSHGALGVYKGLEDGDFSLLWFAAPLALLTLVAALLVEPGARRRNTTALVLTCTAAVLSALAVPLYLLGLFHLPQAVAAVVVVARGLDT